MKKRIRIILLFLAGLILLVVCLPRLCSTGPVRARILEIVNDKIDGSVSVEDWSIRWLRGLKLTDVLFEHSTSVPRVTVEEIRTDRGLLRYAFNRSDFGAVYLDSPQVTVTMTHAEPDAGEEPGWEGAAPGPAERPGQPSDPALAGKRAGLPDLSVGLIVTNGTFTIANGAEPPETIAKQVHFSVALEGRTEPVEVSGGFHSADKKGYLDLNARLQPDSGGSLAHVEFHAGLSAKDLDLAPIARFVRPFADVPRVEGILNADMKARGSARDGIRVTGTVSVPGLRMSGGPFASDTPDLGNVGLSVDGVIGSDNVQIEGLHFESSFLRLTADGDLRMSEKSRLQLGGSLELPGFLGQFPATLGIRDGLQIEEGTLQLDAEMKMRGEDLSLEADVTLPVLRGSLSTGALSSAIAWDQPTVLKLLGRKGPQGVHIDALDFISPFASLNGKGNFEHLELAASTDLGKSWEEIGKIMDLDPWRLYGSLLASATMNRDAAGGDATVQLSLNLEEGGIAHGDESLMPRGSWDIRIASAISTKQKEYSIALIGPEVTWALPVGSGTVAAETILFPGGAAGLQNVLPEIVQGTVEGAFNVGQIMAVLDVMASVPEDLSLHGEARVKLACDLKDSVLSLQPSVVSMRNLNVRRSGKALELPFVNVEMSADAGLTRQVINSQEISVALPGGRMEVRNLVLNRQRPEELSVALAGELDLKQISAMFAPFVSLPEEMSVGGNVAVELHLNGLAPPAGGPDGAPGLSASATVDLEEFDLISAGQPVLENERASISSRIVVGAPFGQSLDIQELNVRSSPFQFDATGGFNMAGGRRSINMGGHVGLDLGAAEPYVRSLAGLDIVMSGKGSERFSFQSAWAPHEGETALGKANLTAVLRADQIRALGFDLQSIDLPVSMQSGLFRGDLRAKINRGQIEVLPELDFSRTGRTLVLRDPAKLISNMELTQEIADSFLGLIHPLFKGTSVIGGGRFHMSMDHFRWPLDPEMKNDASFKGVMKFHDLQLGVSGLLEQLLAAIKVNERVVKIDERFIEIRLEDGKIHSTPMLFRVRGHEVTLSGTVGLDSSLDYVAQLPVTEELLGSRYQKYYEYLEGTTLNLPIRGTVSQPELNAKVLGQAVADLVGQAAGNFLQKEAGKLFDKLLR